MAEDNRDQPPQRLNNLQGDIPQMHNGPQFGPRFQWGQGPPGHIGHGRGYVQYPSQPWQAEQNAHVFAYQQMMFSHAFQNPPPRPEQASIDVTGQSPNMTAPNMQEPTHGNLSQPTVGPSHIPVFSNAGRPLGIPRDFGPHTNVPNMSQALSMQSQPMLYQNIYRPVMMQDVQEPYPTHRTGTNNPRESNMNETPMRFMHVGQSAGQEAQGHPAPPCQEQHLSPSQPPPIPPRKPSAGAQNIQKYYNPDGAFSQAHMTGEYQNAIMFGPFPVRGRQTNDEETKNLKKTNESNAILDDPLSSVTEEESLDSSLSSDNSNVAQDDKSQKFQSLPKTGFRPTPARPTPAPRRTKSFSETDSTTLQIAPKTVMRNRNSDPSLKQLQQPLQEGAASCPQHETWPTSDPLKQFDRSSAQDLGSGQTAFSVYSHTNQGFPGAVTPTSQWLSPQGHNSFNKLSHKVNPVHPSEGQGAVRYEMAPQYNIRNSQPKQNCYDRSDSIQKQVYYAGDPRFPARTHDNQQIIAPDQRPLPLPFSPPSDSAVYHTPPASTRGYYPQRQEFAGENPAYKTTPTAGHDYNMLKQGFRCENTIYETPATAGHGYTPHRNATHGENAAYVIPPIIAYGQQQYIVQPPLHTPGHLDQPQEHIGRPKGLAVEANTNVKETTLQQQKDTDKSRQPPSTKTKSKSVRASGSKADDRKRQTSDDETSDSDYDNGDNDEISTKTSDHDDQDDSNNTNSEDEVWQRHGYVKVEGIAEIKSEDSLWNYFENKRHGGGRIHNMSIDPYDENVMYIQFKKPEHTKSVTTKKGHKLEGHELCVTEYTPPPFCKNKVLIEGLKQSTTEESLFNFLGAKFGLNPVRMVRGEVDESKAIVTMERKIDFESFQKKLNKHSTDGAKLKASRVNVSNCILVNDLPKDCSKDLVENYFEIKKSGGGTVQNVVFNEQRTACRVYFEDPKTVNSVMAKKHRLNQQTLIVTEYQQCLGEPKNWNKKKCVDIQKSVILTDIDSNIIKFLNCETSANRREDIDKKLQVVHAKADWNAEEKGKMVLKLDLTEQSDEDVSNWSDKAAEVFRQSIHDLSHNKCEVPENIFEQVLKSLKVLNVDDPKAIRVDTNKRERVIGITGEKSVVDSLQIKLMQIINAQKDLKNEDYPMKPWECKLLEKLNVHATISDKYPDLKVDFLPDESIVRFAGKPEDIANAKVNLHEIKGTFARATVPLGKASLQLVATDAVNEFLVLDSRKQQFVFEMALSDSALEVYCVADSQIKDVINFIKMSIQEVTLPVCKEALPYLETENWSNQIDNMQKRHEGKLEIVLEGDSLTVAASGDIFENCVAKIEKILRENTQKQSIVTCSEDKYIYVERFLEQRFKELCANYTVKIFPRASHDGILIQGTEEGVKLTEVEVRKIVEFIHCENYDIRDPSFAECISSMEGKNLLRTIEKDLSCLILRKGENRCENIEEVFTVRAYRTDIVVVCGDITFVSADVIVNWADGELKLYSALGKSLKKKGGKSVTDACAHYIAEHGKLGVKKICTTTAGNLQAKQIMHANLPSYHSEHDLENLKTVVSKCLKKLNSEEMASVAFPALGCGSAKYPQKLAANGMAETVADFVEDANGCDIQKIYICDMDKEVIQAFVKALKTKFAQTKPHHVERRERERESRKKTEPVKLGNICVAVVAGQVAHSKADAIVNVTDSSLNLSHGTISASLLKAGGENLQKELKAKNPNGLQEGQVVVTAGHQLKCSSVLHACLQKWNRTNSQAISAFVLNCLKVATAYNHKSIVFPAIGTGKLSYPKKLVAKEMFRTIDDFAKNFAQTTIQDIKIVIYQRDSSTIEAFESESRNWSSSRYGRHQDFRRQRNHSHSSDDDSSDDCVHIGCLSIEVKQGDLTEESTECIVVSIPPSMDLTKGSTSKTLLEKCGQDIADEIEKKRDTFDSYNLVTSSAPNLHRRCKKIFYLTAQSDPSGWKSVIVKALKEAEKRQMRSLAFPALGTGRGTKEEEMAKIMLRGIVEFEKTSPKHLEKIKIVVFKREMLNVFKTKARDFGKYRGGGSTSSSDDETDSRQKTIGSKSSRKRRVTLTVVAKDESDARKAIKRIDDCFDRKDFSDNTIKKFTRHHDKQLSDLETKHHVQIEVDKNRGKLWVSGLTENVRNACDEVHRVMRDALNFDKKKFTAELMSNIVQWSYEEKNGADTKLVPYDKMTNLDIENAHESKKDSITVWDKKKTAYVVDFKRMVEYPKNKPNETLVVKRRDMKAEAVGIPKHWKDLSGNLNMVQLAATDKEYIDAEKSFKASANATVVKIERVQNRTLWLQYQAYKQQMEQRNPPNIQNERILWHGSGSAGIENIKVHGFDRSYSNSSNYGVGVYFSPYANISTGYARGGAGGIRQMFRCRVLTGEFCLAQHGIRTGPPKPSGGPNAKFDSVVDNMANPTEIVIFNDTQAYPEYLISFQ